MLLFFDSLCSAFGEGGWAFDTAIPSTPASKLQKARVLVVM
jgi:hypothetical protein